MDHISKESERFEICGPKMRTLSNSLKDLLHGLVFFNHFIRTETTLRPSLLLKAWNRGAAIMTKPGTVGIDFIIPVVIPGNGGSFGPFIGPWSEEQEAAADSTTAYILIQTKNRLDACQSDSVKALQKCIPITKKSRPRNPTPNFIKHTPKHCYISIVMELGTARKDEHQVQMMNTIDYAALDAMRKRIISKEKDVNTKRDNAKSPKQEKERKQLEERLENDKNEYDIEFSRLSNREKQLPLVAYGLSEDTYKCLENRPNVTRMLHQLSRPYLNPLRGLSSSHAAALRAGRHVMINPDREYSA